MPSLLDKFVRRLGLKPYDWLELGDKAQARGDHVAALTAYEHALRKEPFLAEALYGRAAALHALGRTSDAMESWRRAFVITPAKVELGIQLADALTAQGNGAVGLAAYNQILEKIPDVSIAHYGCATIFVMMGRERDALTAYERAFRGAPPHLQAGLKLADAKLAQGDAAAALDAYRAVLAKAPGLGEAHYGVALAAIELGRREEALGELRCAFDADPPHIAAGLKLADAKLARGDNAGALDVYRAVLDKAPGLGEAHYGVALAEIGLNHLAEALAALRRAWDADPPHLAAGPRLAEMLLVRGDIAAADTIYRRIIALLPHLAEAHFGRGIAAMELGNRETAKASFEHALKLRPDYPAAIVAAGLLSLFPEPGPTRLRENRRTLICVPISPFLRNWLGGQNYLVNFVRILGVLPLHLRPRVVLAMLVDDWKAIADLRQSVESLLASAAVLGMFDGKRQLLAGTPVLERYLRMLRHHRGGDAEGARDLFDRVDFIFPNLYPNWGTARVSQSVFWIPDLQHRFLSANFSAAEIAGRDRDMSALAARPVPVVFSSYDAESHFHRFFPQRRCRTHVWHFVTLPDDMPSAASTDDKNYAALDLPERFYYTPNQFWPHKDHATLFRALRRVLDAERDVTFVCTGTDLTASRDPYAQELLALIEELKLGRQLRLLGVLPRGLQLEIMRRACAVIQPSLFEGWSTVVEDARALGRPLIVSDIPLHREQVDGEAQFFTAGDPTALAAAILQADGKLGAGPDLARETAARQALAAGAAFSAERFMEIMAAEKALARSL